MFSNRVIGSTRFLKMPISSQALYFHLGMKADDDGIVEAYPVVRMTGCSEDDLRVLHSKGFVRILNEDFVTLITDWSEHNKIRADRKIDSIYKGLLVQMIPEKPECQSNVRQVTDKCQSNDNQMSAQVRLGKDRLSKDRIGNNIGAESDEQTTALSGIKLPLVDKTMHDVPLSDIRIWEDAYPAVDIERELYKMIAWLNSNPTKRKTKRGVNRFINSWLSKVQDKGGNGKVIVPTEKPSHEEEPVLDLWVGD